MRDFIKSLRKIQEDSICLVASVEVGNKVLDCENKLSFSGTPFAEAVLKVGKNAVVFKVSDYGAMDDVFNKFAANGGERYGAVI